MERGDNPISKKNLVIEMNNNTKRIIIKKKNVEEVNKVKWYYKESSK